MASGICYLQIVPVIDEYSGSKKKIKGLKVSGLTQGVPPSPEPGSRVIKLSIEIPDDQLMPLEVKAMPDDVRLNAYYEATMESLGKKA